MDEKRKAKYFQAQTWSPTKKLVLATLLASITAILQASGNYIPIIGLFLSTFATFTIFLSMIISIRYGLLTFFLAIILLILLEPAEFFVFPFTTGLLGVCLGCGARWALPRAVTNLICATMLTSGIFFVLYVFGFPVLGPMLPGFHWKEITYVFLFALFYSHIWLQISLVLLKKLQKHI